MSLRGVVPLVERLWVLGDDLQATRPCVAIVGARKPTAYGVDVAFSLAGDLASCGICIVSGMALGIDSAAHEGALAAGGKTIAVLGSGLDRPYPPSNRDLFDRIARAGCVVSEYEPGTPAFKKHFPMRNRIIAGLSLGVILVQAASETAGGMITAAQAGSFNRQVLAVPGDVRSDLSRGPHALLRDGAALVASAGDVLKALELELEWVSPSGDAPPLPDTVEDDERAMLASLSAGPARVDELAARACLDLGAAARALVRLEIGGFVEATGGSYRRIR